MILTFNKLNSLNKSFGSFKGGSFGSYMLFSTSLPSFSIFDSKNIINSLSDLNIHDKEDFTYVKNVEFDRKIKFAKNNEKDILCNLGPLDSPSFINNLKSLLNSFEDYQLYAVYFRVPTNSGGIVSTHRQLFLDKNSNPDWIKSRISYKITILQGEFYEVSTYSTVIAQYHPVYVSIDKPFKKDLNIPNAFLKSSDLKRKMLFNKHSPLTMDLSKFGILHSSYENENGNLIKIYLFNEIKFIVEELDPFSRLVKVYDKTDLKIYEFTDENFGDYFIRNINDFYIKIDHYENVLYVEKTFNTRFVNKIQRDLIKKDKIITFDIEAFLHPISKDLYESMGINEDKKDKDLKMFIPFACGFFDGTSSYKYYLTDYPDYKEMLKVCIMDMANPKYKDYVIYAHYGGKFDYIFILDILSNLKEIVGNPKMVDKDGDAIGFDVKINNPLHLNKNNKSIISTLKFRDSYKLLPHNLRKLTKEFKVECIKGDFPYIFPNSYNLDYIGNFPDYSYFNTEDISLKEYTILKNENPYLWNLKEECLKYLEKDLIGLHQVLLNFSDLIYNKYRINITKVYSISSLAMKVFTSNFLENDYTIPIISNKKVHMDIRNALYGGRVEIFKPIVKFFKSFDVNSIYPFAMLFPMPVGSPIYSTNTNLKELFGIVYATVYVSEYADPVLPKRLKTGELIFPRGTWTAWFFSEELKNAQYFGIKVTVHHSYLFNKSYDLFKKYILNLFEMKRTNKDSIRAIYKLLMNSSFGRWALKFYKTVTKYVSKEEADYIESTHIVQERINYANNKVYLRYNIYPDEEICTERSEDFNLELIKSLNSEFDSISSIPIGVAITSWARIFMSSFLFNPANPVAYSDTDCIHSKKDLAIKHINDLLGGWKLEHEVIQGLFVLDKVYNLNTPKGSVTKNKGMNKKLNYLNFIDLYKGKSLDLEEDRWIRDLSNGLIYINKIDIHINNVYTKRKKVFHKGFWVDTEPLTIFNDDIINKPVLSNFTYDNYLYIREYKIYNLIYNTINDKKSLILYKQTTREVVVRRKTNLSLILYQTPSESCPKG